MDVTSRARKTLKRHHEMTVDAVYNNANSRLFVCKKIYQYNIPGDTNMLDLVRGRLVLDSAHPELVANKNNDMVRDL